MSHSNGIIVAPVNTDDVSSVINVASHDVGYLCSNLHGRINKWSKIKPILVAYPYDDVEESEDKLRESDTSNGYYYGVKIVTKNPCEIHTHAFAYKPPILGENWDRLTDWDGYDHNAKPYPAINADWIKDDGDLGEVNFPQGFAFSATFKLAPTSENQNGINPFECLAGSNWTQQHYYPILIISSNSTPVAFWARTMVGQQSGESYLNLTQLTNQVFYVKNDFEQNNISKDGVVASVSGFFQNNYQRKVSIAFLTVPPDATGVEINGVPLDFAKWTRLDYISGIDIPFLPMPNATGVDVMVKGTADAAQVAGVRVISAIAKSDGIHVTAERNFDSYTSHYIYIGFSRSGMLFANFNRIFDEDYLQSGLSGDHSMTESYIFSWQDLGYLISGIPADVNQLRLLWKSYTGTTPDDNDLFEQGSMAITRE